MSVLAGFRPKQANSQIIFYWVLTSWPVWDIVRPVGTVNTLNEHTMSTKTLPRTIGELLRDHAGEFYSWQSENVQAGGCARSGSDARDRYNRCQDAAEDGCDGSTHAENIDDFREFGLELYKAAERELEGTGFEGTEAEAHAMYEAAMEALEEARDEFEADCDECVRWHEKNGSLYQQGA